MRTNMSFFTEAMRMFSPFAQARGDAKGEVSKAEPKAENPGELDTLKRQMADMQAKLDASRGNRPSHEARAVILRARGARPVDLRPISRRAPAGLRSRALERSPARIAGPRCSRRPNRRAAAPSSRRPPTRRRCRGRDDGRDARAGSPVVRRTRQIADERAVDLQEIDREWRSCFIAARPPPKPDTT